MDNSKYQKKIVTIPNILSLFRICLIPVMIWLYCAKGNTVWTTILLVISGMTDVIDGYIARRFDMVSDFGKAFDPIADKLTQAAMLCCLIIRFPWMLLPFLVLVVKEIFTGVTALMAIHKTKYVPMAVWHGKVSTMVLYVMMLVHLVWYQIPSVCSYVLVGVCTAMMLVSAALYGKYNVSLLHSKSLSKGNVQR